MTDLSGLVDLAESIARYEAWMREQLADGIVEDGLVAKHRTMREEDPFLFLRATCWRWAEAAPFLCPELMEAPHAPSVGDAHAGNFGLWRDASGRLVWGVNDFDEAARLPWPLDLVRLCASLALAIPGWKTSDIAELALDGYRAGIAEPRAMVLERGHRRLRDAFAADDAYRQDFWEEREEARPTGDVPPALRAALLAALPEPGLPVSISPRQAGAGSLGRPRFVAYCSDYRGGPIAVEVKAQLPSCWASGHEPGLSEMVAHGRFRSPDPLFHYAGGFSVRRLSPNSRKLEFGEIRSALADRLVRAMAGDLATIHAGDAAAHDSIRDALSGRKKHGWLARAAERVAIWTADEHRRYRRQPLAAAASLA
ncbi:DUF2252 family protein [Sphingomonas sp. JC676]|uniref:DUF2252 family protein n=1 Tax=Sphingomonas sp. JC676 TaxID=2768065 RepID=UPI001CA778A9|nr:DUF2252 family protein [Sphingomonas sp. JC676]